MKRFLITLAVFAGAILLLRRLSGLFVPRPAMGPAVNRPVRASELVRDKVCNTFLPRDRAISSRCGEETLYFCSEECRRRHSAGRLEVRGGSSGAPLASHRT